MGPIDVGVDTDSCEICALQANPAPCLNVNSVYFEFYLRLLGRGVDVSEGCFVRVRDWVIQYVKTRAK